MTPLDKSRILEEFKVNRYAAHQYLFAHRHKEKSPDFHRELIELYNSPDDMVALMVFRGGAKSTLLEEYVLLSVLFYEFRFPLIVGNSWNSAVERLTPIKLELETNELLLELFGDQKSSPWAQDEIVLANGAKIQAIGARQSMRGVKHNDERPDLAAIDDLEDEENIATEEARRKTERWLNGTLRPALNPKTGKVRFVGTAIHPKSLIQKKCDDKNWLSRKYPVLYIDPVTGEEKSAWPDRFSYEFIQKIRNDYLESGNLIEFEQEYMCRAEDVAGKPFQASMIKVQPAPSFYIPKYLIVDPARTVKERSARTGYVVGSWFSNNIIVHEGKGSFHKPNEIVNEIFELNARFNPVEIGVEVNALDDFILQPLQTEMVKRGVSLPIRPLYAPKSKEDFIKSLQTFYSAGNVSHVKHLPDLESELLQFPTGRRDVPNALAYLLRMCSGKPVYEDFTYQHIVPLLEASPVLPKWLLFSSRPALTCATLVQYRDGIVRILFSWVKNQPPQEAFTVILREAIMVADGQVKLGAPLEQFDRYTNTGLPAAAQRDRVTVTQLHAAAKSEGVLTPWLTKREKGEPAFLVSQAAMQFINGMAAGYKRNLERDGTLEELPADNQYRVLIEAVESFVSWFDAQKVGDNDPNVRYAVSPDGRRYLTSLPGPR